MNQGLGRAWKQCWVQPSLALVFLSMKCPSSEEGPCFMSQWGRPTRRTWVRSRLGAGIGSDSLLFGIDGKKWLLRWCDQMNLEPFLSWVECSPWKDADSLRKDNAEWREKERAVQSFKASRWLTSIPGSSSKKWPVLGSWGAGGAASNYSTAPRWKLLAGDAGGLHWAPALSVIAMSPSCSDSSW